MKLTLKERKQVKEFAKSLKESSLNDVFDGVDGITIKELKNAYYGIGDNLRPIIDALTEIYEHTSSPKIKFELDRFRKIYDIFDKSKLGKFL